MLGRLRMTVPKCIQAYQKLSKIIFKDGERNFVSYGLKGAWYDEKTFVKALQDFLTSDEFKPRFSADELMADPDSNACKVYAEYFLPCHSISQPSTQLRPCRPSSERE
jgi:hypothetical protein